MLGRKGGRNVPPSYKYTYAQTHAHVDRHTRILIYTHTHKCARTYGAIGN